MTSSKKSQNEIDQTWEETLGMALFGEIHANWWEQLFIKSAERYRELTKPLNDKARKKPDSWLAAKHLLEGLVEFFTTVRVAQRVCAN